MTISPAKTSLANMTVGHKGKVVGFKDSGKAYRKKLLAMGLTKGTEFTINRLAPMGDPVEIVVRGYNLSLRKQEAAVLLVEGV
ncbi:MAG: ferrous iron transport protein A [Desulfobacteraceae bacterium 4572_35.1]|nr:MAG: ferrous iron transport protein A [Desulfobacteraceae bacterium 4572_35.1]